MKRQRMTAGDMRWLLHRAWDRLTGRRCFGCHPDLSTYPLTTLTAFEQRDRYFIMSGGKDLRPTGGNATWEWSEARGVWIGTPKP